MLRTTINDSHLMTSVINKKRYNLLA